MGQTVIVGFIMGFLSCALLFMGATSMGTEVPLITGMTPLHNISPSDWINGKDIQVYDDRVVIYIKNPTLSSYAPTGSMKPLFDATANGIRIKPEREEDIHVGDIISYQKEGQLIVHRIMEQGTDEEGTYYITQGDNNPVSDGKIRYEDIQYVTIGILW